MSKAVPAPGSNTAAFNLGPSVPMCGRPAARLDGTSPHSIRCRVAFPTLRPPRLRLSGGPAPWTKRGKRASWGALFEVWHAGTGGSRRDPNIAPFSLGRSLPRRGVPPARSGRNIAPFKPGPSCVSHPSPTAPSAVWGTGAVDEAWKTRQRRCIVRGWARGRSGNRRHRTSPHSKFPGERCRCAEYWPRDLDTTSPHSIRAGPFADAREPAVRSGRNIAPFSSGPSCVFHPSPTAPSAVWGTGAVDEAWKTHDRCRFGRGRFGSRTAYREHQKQTPYDTKADAFVINGTALTGLSTLCPRRRSPTNKRRGGQRVGNPHDDLGRSQFRLSRTPPVPKHRPIQPVRAVRPEPPNTVDIYSIVA